MKQLHSDYLAIGNKYPDSNNPNRYTKRVEQACEEIREMEQYQCGDYNSRPKLFLTNLPKLAIKYNVKLNRLYKIFEV